jgi:hypothetical protein
MKIGGTCAASERLTLSPIIFVPGGAPTTHEFLSEEQANLAVAISFLLLSFQSSRDLGGELAHPGRRQACLQDHGVKESPSKPAKHLIKSI